MRDTDGENTEHRVARPNLRIVITFRLFSISYSKIWGKPFKGKLAVRDRSVFFTSPLQTRSFEDRNSIAFKLVP